MRSRNTALRLAVAIAAASGIASAQAQTPPAGAVNPQDPSTSASPPAGTAENTGVAGNVSAMELREQVRSDAVGLGLLGWVRLMEDGTLCVHAEDRTLAGPTAPAQGLFLMRVTY